MNALQDTNERINQLCKNIQEDNQVLNRLNSEVDKIAAHRDAWQKRIDRMQTQLEDLRDRRTYLELND